MIEQISFVPFLPSPFLPVSPSPHLRLGLMCVKGLRADAGRAIVRERVQRSFTSIDDLHRRVPELRKDELRKLAAVGALNFIDEEKLCVFAPLRESSLCLPTAASITDEISRKGAKAQIELATS